MARPDDPRTFSDDEAEEILRRVIQKQHEGSGGGLSRGDLVEAARQLGIAPEQVDRAIAERDAERDEDAELARVRARRRAGFVSHLVPFLAVNAFLIAIDLLSGGGLWFYWPLLGWGLGLVMHAWQALGPTTEQDRERLRKRKERERRRKEREARREALRKTAEEFEGAVSEGVQQLLSGIGEGIRQGIAQPPPHAKPAPRVRVAAGDEPAAEGEAREAAREDERGATGR